jgi:ankyrin repeat protein
MEHNAYNRQLIDAAREDNEMKIIYADFQGAYIDYQDETGWTALHHATAKNNFYSVKTLLNLGADPNIPTPGGWTPLHCAFDFHALYKNRGEIIRELL